MIPLFLGITFLNLICLIMTFTMGWSHTMGRNWGSMHILAGALTALVCIGVHCIVFTYFIATAKWVQHAVSVKRLSPDFNKPTRSFKAQAFPAALLAMASVFAAAIVGAAVANYGIDRRIHLGFAIGAIAVNLVVSCVEYRAIRKNGELIDSVLAEIQRVDPTARVASIV